MRLTNFLSAVFFWGDLFLPQFYSSLVPIFFKKDCSLLFYDNQTNKKISASCFVKPACWGRRKSEQVQPFV